VIERLRLLAIRLAATELLRRGSLLGDIHESSVAADGHYTNDSLKLVIVRDMWLTGFDAPSMHTMYIDKPMRGHGLMQAIARVNRVFRDKPAGLIVDYIGIAQNLKTALGDYSRPDQEQIGINEEEAVAVLLEKYEIVKAMFHGFDYSRALTGTPHERLVVMAGAIEWILASSKRTRPARPLKRRRSAIMTRC
jgi:type I restriction enzyme R subunit